MIFSFYGKRGYWIGSWRDGVQRVGIQKWLKARMEQRAITGKIICLREDNNLPTRIKSLLNYLYI